MKNYLSMFRYFYEFMGVSSKREFWEAMLINFVIDAILLVLFYVNGFFAMLFLAYVVISVIPVLSIMTRRLHDADYSGFNLFYLLIPIVGVVIVAYFLCKPTAYNPATTTRIEKPSKTTIQNDNDHHCCDDGCCCCEEDYHDEDCHDEDCDCHDEDCHCHDENCHDHNYEAEHNHDNK